MEDSATPPAPPVLRVEGLCKNFQQGGRSLPALSGVDLRVDAGELVAVMGASGSGKSTLLHCLAGLTPPDAGTMTFMGEQDLAAFSDREATLFRRDRLGLVFQAFNLLPTLTVAENLTLPLISAGRTAEAAQRLPPLLDRLGLTDRRTHRPDALSGGEQQRVAIGRALITDPALILADEPTGSLDSVTGQSICELLAELCRDQHRAVVVVTHEPAVAVWANRVVVLKDGKNVAELPPTDDVVELSARYREAVQDSAA